MSCEDYPCCGHDICPDFEDGVQMNMRCICGAIVSIDANCSICETCLAIETEELASFEYDHSDIDDDDDDFDQDDYDFVYGDNGDEY